MHISCMASSLVIIRCILTVGWDEIPHGGTTLCSLNSTVGYLTDCTFGLIPFYLLAQAHLVGLLLNNHSYLTLADAGFRDAA